MRLNERIFLDNIKDEIVNMEEEYYFGEDHNDYAKMRDHFIRLEKLVSALDDSMRLVNPTADEVSEKAFWEFPPLG